MKDFLVSIIVPVYNVENYISACIESIQSQTYQNLQIILVDDGSTDQSGILCDAYAERDQRISVVHQPNGGLVVARKSGLKYAEGEYIGFVDGDDSIAPDMYQALVDMMEASKADFAHSGFWEQGEKWAVEMPRVMELTNRNEKLKCLRDVLVGRSNCITPSIWSKLFKSDWIKKCYVQISDVNQYGEDIINLCICVMECSKIALTNEAYYFYRVRKESLSHREDLDSLKNMFKMYEGICDALVSHGFYQELKGLIDKILWNNLLGRMDSLGRNFWLEKYFLTNVDILKGKNIVVYGAGRVGRDYYAQICRYTECKVVAWVDAHPERYNYPYIRVSGIEELDSLEFDLLVIAVKEEKTAQEICDQLVDKGIERNKIYWSEPEGILPDDLRDA